MLLVRHLASTSSQRYGASINPPPHTHTLLQLQRGLILKRIRVLLLPGWAIFVVFLFDVVLDLPRGHVLLQWRHILYGVRLWFHVGRGCGIMQPSNVLGGAVCVGLVVRDLQRWLRLERRDDNVLHPVRRRHILKQRRVLVHALPLWTDVKRGCVALLRSHLPCGTICNRVVVRDVSGWLVLHGRNDAERSMCSTRRLLLSSRNAVPNGFAVSRWLRLSGWHVASSECMPVRLAHGPWRDARSLHARLGNVQRV